MSIDRRDFLKIAAGGGALALAKASPAEALFVRETKAVPAGALGILYDSTVCIGCKACMSACKRANDLPRVTTGMGEPLWDSPLDTDAFTYNVIKAYKSGTGLNKDREEDGHAFIKRHCMHCADPACVSACPVSALKKDPENGVVKYDKNACIGCRYCQIACPFNIPKFEFDLAFPRIKKCQLCDHLDGYPKKYSACCEFCPTGASIFGRRDLLLEEAKKRLALKPGDFYDYPVQHVSEGAKMRKQVEVPYLDRVYGEKDGGGTQYLMLSAVPFALLGMPPLDETPIAARTEGIQHALYRGMVIPGAVLAGLLFAAYRSTKGHE